MQPLYETDFHWHSEQPDAPHKSAAEMKAFMDAPIRILFAKLNELIGAQSGDAATLNELREKMREVIGSGYKGDPLENPENKDILVSLSDLATRIDSLRGGAQYEGEFVNSLYGLTREMETKQDAFTLGEGLCLEEGVLSVKDAVQFRDKINDMEVDVSYHTERFKEWEDKVLSEVIETEDLYGKIPSAEALVAYVAKKLGEIPDVTEVAM